MEFHNSMPIPIPGKFELACNKCACMRRSCLKPDMVEKLLSVKRNIIYGVKA